MADKSVQSMEDELAKLRRLLQEKDATIAQLEQKVAQHEEEPDEEVEELPPTSEAFTACNEYEDTSMTTPATVATPPVPRASSQAQQGRSKGTPTIPRAFSETPRSTSHTISSARITSTSETSSPQWGRYNPFRDGAAAETRISSFSDEDLPSPSSTIITPPITPITQIVHPQPKTTTTSTLSPNSRRRTVDPSQLAMAQAQLLEMRRSTSVSTKEHDHTMMLTNTPPLLAAPSSELDWSDDNPFAFLKTPAPAPPPPLSYHHGEPTNGSQGNTGHGKKPLLIKRPHNIPNEVNSSGETLPARRRPRSHSSTLKMRHDAILTPPPPLVPPPMPVEITTLSEEDARRLQIIQAYFRGRIERAKVKHMVEKQVMGRRFTMEEILLSERRYVHHLDLVITHFLRPLQKTDILTQAEMTAIFMNIEKLHQIARNFLRQLEELFVEDPLVIGHRVGLLFLNTIPEWRIYSYFINLFEGATIQVAKCKERKSFREWLSKAESHPALEKLGMMDYMIAAAKRIPQYQLLLRAVKKNTPKSSRHYSTLKTAKTMISELAQFLNERKKSFDNMRKISFIQRSLHGKIPNLQTPGREFLAESVIKEEDAAARLIIDRRIFLFNDSILVATAATNKFDRLLYLYGAEMNSRFARKMVLRIDDVSLVAVFQTEPEKVKWVALVGHAIETLAFQEQESVLKDFAPSGVSRPKVLNSVVLHQGYLLKHRRSSGGWNKRWFVLEQGILYYFSSPSKMQAHIAQRATIDLASYAIKGPLDWSSSGKRRYGFELYSQTRPVFVLAAENSHDRDEWVKALAPFLMSAKSSDRDGSLLAASTSTDIARTSSSRVLLPTLRPTAPADDLIQWSDDNDPPSLPSPSGLTVSSKFYFNEDVMSRAVDIIPEEGDWFTQDSSLASPSTKVYRGRSFSSSSASFSGS